MKHALLALGLLALAGAGCSTSVVTQTPSASSSVQTASPQSASSTPPTTATTTATPTQSIAPIPTPTKPPKSLLPLPTEAVADGVIQDGTWAHGYTLRPTMDVAYPDKGPYAVTWNHRFIANNDPNLQGDCYVTSDVVYQRTDFGTWSGGVCQTTTDFRADHGVRTDYFVMRGDDATHLFTFTKTYPKGFDMNLYGATLNHLILIMD